MAYEYWSGRVSEGKRLFTGFFFGGGGGVIENVLNSFVHTVLTISHPSNQKHTPIECLSCGCFSDEYVTASMDEIMTSADEDPHNSTGSFSENAWDNYQVGCRFSSLRMQLSAGIMILIIS